MRNKFYSILLLAASLFTFISCNETEKKIVYLETREDGLIYKTESDTPFTGTQDAVVEGQRIVYDVVDGKKNGIFKVYNKNKQLEILGQVENNKYEGEWKYFYPDGNLELKGTFENDTASGEWTWYYKNGIIKEKGKFLNGKRVGLWKMFDRNGEVIKDSVYKPFKNN